MTGPGSMTGQPDSQRQVVVSLGSNLGDRLANLQLGIDVLASSGITGLAVSGVYQTAPVGGPGQGDYLNAVLLALSGLAAGQILSAGAAAETAAGRVRTVRWGPRTLDVDFIAVGELTSTDPELTLPHPRAHERAFVLVPWLEVQPGAVLPGWGLVADLPAAADTAGLRRRADLALRLPAGREAESPCG